MPHLREINTLLETYAKGALIDAESRRRVLALARPNSKPFFQVVGAAFMII